MTKTKTYRGGVAKTNTMNRIIAAMLAIVLVIGCSPASVAFGVDAATDVAAERIAPIEGNGVIASYSDGLEGADQDQDADAEGAEPNPGADDDREAAVADIGSEPALGQDADPGVRSEQGSGLLETDEAPEPVFLAEGVEPLAAPRSSVNVGDPFTNGDLTWNYNTQMYRLTGVTIRVSNLTPIGSGSGPFAYPEALSKANAIGAGNFRGWGIGRYSYGETVVTSNTRNLNWSGSLPSVGHCCQAGNDDTEDLPRNGNLYLIEEESYWSDDGGTYYATLIILVENAHEHGIWDQATIGIDKLHAEWNVKGDLALMKVSTQPEITDGNSCYSLEGAVFGVYKEDGTPVGDITTDALGEAKMEDIVAGKYYLIEKKAPKGYVLDSDTKHWVTVVAGKEATVTVADRPYNDPVYALVRKSDPVTGGTAQGGSTLGGAEFTVKYYPGDYASGVDPATLGVSPTRTWVMATDSDGFSYFDADHVVSGDPFYIGATGAPTFPLGTVTAQETKAPKGYLLSTPELPNRVFVQRITQAGIDGDSAEVWNEHEFLDQVQAAELWITKIGTKVGDDVAGGGSAEAVPLAGVEFSVYGSADYDDNGDGTYTVHPGAAAKATIVTDKNGFAKTEYLDRPDGQHGALVYDTYLVVETGPAEDYDPIDPFIFSADTDGKTYFFMANDKFVNAGVELVKVDAESGLPVMQEGAVFRVLDEHKSPIIWEQTYPEHVTFTDLETGPNGTVLLPEKLNAGDYWLHEVSAPEGYLLGSADVPFTVDATTDWDDPLTVSYPDAPAKGRIEIAKTESDPFTGEDTGEPVPGAVYGVYAAEDIVTKDGVLHHSAGDLVDRVAIGDGGRGESGELYLGKYTVREIVAPDGWAVDSSEYEVVLEYKDQHTAVVLASVHVVDKPTSLVLRKVGEKPDGSFAELAETKWRVWAEDASGSVVYDEEMTTGEDGTFALTHLPRGTGYTYFVQETMAPEGYIEDGEIHSFVVDGDGLIDGSSVYEITAKNYLERIITAQKVDSDTGGGVSDTGFELDRWSGGGKPADAGGDDTGGSWVEVARLDSDASGDAMFEGLEFGWYRLTELWQNPDYMSPGESGLAGTFYIECSASSGVNQVQVIENAPITVETTVDKSTISQTSAGLVYEDADGNPVSNVGVEAYRYDVGFTSGDTNVFADEYWVTDECQMTKSPWDMRIESIALPTVKGDTDGKVHVLYRTNLGGSSAEGMAFSQPELHAGDTLADGTDRFDAAGWDYLGEYPAEKRVLIDPDSFLADGEYITGITLCYGAVEVGFESETPLSYMVSATHALAIDTIIPNGATSHITRNWSNVRHTAEGDVPKDPSGPHDDDADKVYTTVIDTFSIDFDRSLGGWSSGSHAGLVRAGDWIVPAAAIALAAAASAAASFAAVAKRRADRKREMTG